MKFDKRFVKKTVAGVLCVSMLAALLTGCGKKTGDAGADTNAAAETEETATEEIAKTTTGSKPVSGDIEYLSRPSLTDGYTIDGYEDNLTPQVPDYSLAGDFSNIINPDIVEYSTQEFKDKLLQNLFVVGEESGREFYETYEFNSYSQTPNFVTVDSLMHSYHLYFAHLLKNCEKTYLSDSIKVLSKKMYDAALDSYGELKGTDWEKAAYMEAAYFAVGCQVIGENVDVPTELSDVVNEEVSKIMDADDIYDSAIFADLKEDYSQYKPRGYYDTGEELKKYFRAMMWYGRMGFPTNDEDALKASLLITMALNSVGEEQWNSVYAVTSFFAGASDDMGYCEYLPIAEAAYGKVPAIQDVISDEAAWKTFAQMASKLAPPQIQSVPVYEDEDNVVNEFRFMGQRFTIDASIMQNLIYRAVDKNENDEARMLPDAMDVPAALGSETAKEIALESGASEFPDYLENLSKLREEFGDDSSPIWSSSLYAQWLNTLKPLLVEKGSGYPSFMQNNEWTKKTLETFAGSYTELKHDTVLYAKQPMAEMGGGWEEDIDDRGYVEPEPLVYYRFAQLAMATAEGLKKYHMISSDDLTNLDRLTTLATQLMVISQKELKNELCTDEEFELIRNYGGNIEHFWHEAMKDETDQDYFTSEEFPAALVVDVATDPNGSVLELGDGNPREIYVVVPVDGKLRVCTGSVYNFYQLEWPLSDRLTDDTWREMIGAMPGEGYLYNRDESIDNPEWTKSYRAKKWDYSAWE